MSFTISFYNNNSDKRKVGKSLTSTTSYTGTLKDETSIVNPTILINAGSISGNYAYISQFNRYYFVNDIKSIRNGLWEVSLHVDVLETYKTQIKASSAVIERQENSYNNYLQDNMAPVATNVKQRIYKFDNGASFNTENILLYINSTAFTTKS